MAQKVGVVLSGGGAKGIAHIGVLKALEENEIPIDYIVGTSMGGIIGGCYAAGMSPAAIERMILSEDFLGWVNGFPEKGVNYHYSKDEPGPHFLKLNLSLDSTFSFQLNSSIANDVSLNFALAEKMAQGEAISNRNFDSLFVPLRVVASDIFTQSEVILSKGSLSDALRATQTVPFFYNPIRVDGRYLFDGGVYNNFPVDVAQKNFSPDVIIGSNVSSKIFDEYPYKDDDKLINNSLLFMFLDKSDPTDIPETGVYIQPDLEGYSSLDFNHAKALIDSGYAQTIRQIKEIKEKTRRSVSCDEIAAKRNSFNDRSKPWVFDKVSFKSFNSKQRKYIRKIFKVETKRPTALYFKDVKKGYYKLASESFFSNIYPSMIFNKASEKFTLQLTRRHQKNFQVDFGGVLATRDVSNIALALNYYYFNRALTHAYVAFQTGSFYKSVIVRTRIDLPYLNQFYIEPEAEFNGWDYPESVDLLQSTDLTILKRIDRKVGLHFGKAIGNHFKGDMSIVGFHNLERFSNKKSFISTDTLDQMTVNGFKAGFSFSMNDLNRKQYASYGKAFSLSGYYYNAREEYFPGNTADPARMRNTKDHQWFRLKATAEHYFSRGWYRPGYFAEAVISNQPLFTNYFGTIINAPAFFPLQDSRTLILENYRAFNYAAFGIRNVFIIKRNRLDLRLEGYAFKAFEEIREGQNQEAFRKTDLTQVYFAGTAGLVFHSPVGPISFSVNYYNDRENEIGALLHVGFLLFNKHSLE
jgi:NTE family protein